MASVTVPLSRVCLGRCKMVSTVRGAAAFLPEVDGFSTAELPLYDVSASRRQRSVSTVALAPAQAPPSTASAPQTLVGAQPAPPFWLSAAATASARPLCVEIVVYLPGESFESPHPRSPLAPPPVMEPNTAVSSAITSGACTVSCAGHVPAIVRQRETEHGVDTCRSKETLGRSSAVCGKRSAAAACALQCAQSVRYMSKFYIFSLSQSMGALGVGYQ